MVTPSPPIFADTLPGYISLPVREIAGFWRRLGAFLIDSLIVGLGALLITFPFSGSLSRVGAYGRLLGVLVALPYYAILNSKVGNGQTLGKRWLDIRVVDQAGNPISLARSTVRYAVLAIPYFLDDLVLPATRTPWLVSYLLVLLGLVSFATLYLILFNLQTRQGVHDLVTGTFVAQASVGGPVDVRPIWKPHWIILASLLVMAFVGPQLLGNRVLRQLPYGQILEDVRLLESMSDVQAASAQIRTDLSSGNSYGARSLVLTVYWTGKSTDREAFADTIAKEILDSDESAKGYNTIRVELVRGYDLGITHARVSYPFEHSPADWLARQSKTSPLADH